MSLPTQDKANMASPEEHFVWALVGMAPEAGAPLILPLPIMRQWSRHLWDCGFRHDPELQTIHYMPPNPNATVMEMTAGKWVDGPPPQGEEKDEIDALIDNLDPQVVERIMARRGGGGR